MAFFMGFLWDFIMGSLWDSNGISLTLLMAFFMGFLWDFLWDLYGIQMGYTSGNHYSSLLLNMAIEIADVFPIRNGGSFHRYVSHCRRVSIIFAG